MKTQNRARPMAMVLIICLNFLAPAALASPALPAPTSATAMFKLGDKKQSGGVTVEPLQVVEDSRCPKSVHCFWAGILILKARVQAGATSQEILLGNSGGKAVAVSQIDHKRFQKKAVRFDKYDIALTSVEPAPQSPGAKIDPSSYAFEIKVGSAQDKK
jgi:hypothetical protein